MKRVAHLAAVLLPLAGLAGLWGQSHHTFEQGTEWEVPIQGYDPRDYLRGHYVEFAYDWPGADQFPPETIVHLCLEGDPPTVTRVTASLLPKDCAHPLTANASAVYGLEGLRRGRLYLGQDRAAALEQQLRNRDLRGIVTIRQRDDGSFTPVAIRFRPLTPEERAARDTPPAPVVPAAPKIMTEE